MWLLPCWSPGGDGEEMGGLSETKCVNIWHQWFLLTVLSKRQRSTWLWVEGLDPLSISTGHALKPQVSSIFTNFVEGLKKFYITKVILNDLAEILLLISLLYVICAFWKGLNKFYFPVFPSSKVLTPTSWLLPPCCSKGTVRGSCSTKNKFTTLLQHLGK